MNITDAEAKICERVEAKIRERVAAAKAGGWQIMPDVYFVPAQTGRPTPGRCCVLGACVTDTIVEDDMHANVVIRAAEVLGIFPSDAIAIATGFDFPDEAKDTQNPFVHLGARLIDVVDK